jgi:hypothetical protein
MFVVLCSVAILSVLQFDAAVRQWVTTDSQNIIDRRRS